MGKVESFHSARLFIGRIQRDWVGLNRRCAETRRGRSNNLESRNPRRSRIGLLECSFRYWPDPAGGTHHNWSSAGL
jgi:hypothetical protein